MVERLQGVVIEQREAGEVLRQQDAGDTLFYVDPPYLMNLRAPGNIYDRRLRMYRHDMDDEGHCRLLDMLPALKGMVVLSGYRSALYDDALPGWRRVETEAFADNGGRRTECLWLNPACVAALGHGPLFSREGI